MPGRAKPVKVKPAAGIAKNKNSNAVQKNRSTRKVTSQAKSQAGQTPKRFQGAEPQDPEDTLMYAESEERSLMNDSQLLAGSHSDRGDAASPRGSDDFSLGTNAAEGIFNGHGASQSIGSASPSASQSGHTGTGGVIYDAPDANTDALLSARNRQAYLKYLKRTTAEQGPSMQSAGRNDVTNATRYPHPSRFDASGDDRNEEQYLESL